MMLDFVLTRFFGIVCRWSDTELRLFHHGRISVLRSVFTMYSAHIYSLLRVEI